MAFGCFAYYDFTAYPVFQLLDMAYKAYRKTVVFKFFEAVDHGIDKFFVQRTEPFVQEEKFNRPQRFCMNRL